MESWPAVAVPALPPAPPGGHPDLLLHDAQSRGVRPLDAPPVARVYVCGITPYDATHLGHALTYLGFDTLVRVLRDGGHEVHYVQNVTDVDEPLFERAARDGIRWQDLAAGQIALFRGDMSVLRVLPPTAYVGAVESIPVIGELVERLRAAGAAYELDGDLYFPVAAAPRLGDISHLDRAGMLALAAERGGDPDRPGKKDPLDPVLWWGPREGEPAWPSALGPGRPGWHVECTAIAMDHLGDVIEVQGGGADLAFPHHEMSIAHAEALTGEPPFARHVVHTGMLGLDGHKMSKSLGNLVFVSQLVRDGVDPAAIRLALLTHRYREEWEWQPELLTTAAARLLAWRAGVARPAGPSGAALLAGVRRALADDLDTPAALALVDAWAAADGEDPEAPRVVRHTVDALLGVLL